MSLMEISSAHLGREASCSACRAGRLISFNWDSARTTHNPELLPDPSAFVRPRQLRHGALHECASCHQPWYLYGEPAIMNFVPRQRLELIGRWNDGPITLGREHSTQLLEIGATPSDQYGNGRQYHETPCTVTTVSGEQIDLAIVSVQRHAPFEEWRECRLATDIAAIRPSPYALPLPVRIASSQADEIRMGLAPTLIAAPNGQVLALNWTQSFLVLADCRAGDVVLSSQRFDWSNPPAVCGRPTGVVYFVADGLAAQA